MTKENLKSLEELKGFLEACKASGAAITAALGLNSSNEEFKEGETITILAEVPTCGKFKGQPYLAYKTNRAGFLISKNTLFGALGYALKADASFEDFLPKCTNASVKASVEMGTITLGDESIQIPVFGSEVTLTAHIIPEAYVVSAKGSATNSQGKKCPTKVDNRKNLVVWQ